MKNIRDLQALILTSGCLPVIKESNACIRSHYEKYLQDLQASIPTWWTFA